MSLAGLGLMLLYTISTSFSYGWQKSVQFSSIYLTVLFPVLFAGLAQNVGVHRRSHWLVRIALFVTLGVMAYGFLGNAADNFQSAGDKGLTRTQLAWRDQVAAEFPGRIVYVDGATFRAAFFHSMWSARIFAGNPVAFFPREEQDGGYLQSSVSHAGETPPSGNALYYVAADWARAFDYAPVPMMADRVGALLTQHNLVTDLRGFDRKVGLPKRVGHDFALTLYPYADGWLEMTLACSGQAAAGCRLRGAVATEAGQESVTAVLDAEHHLVVRFPLTAGVRNILSAQIVGIPSVETDRDANRYPFLLLAVQSRRSANLNNVPPHDE